MFNIDVFDLDNSEEHDDSCTIIRAVNFYSKLLLRDFNTSKYTINIDIISDNSLKNSGYCYSSCNSNNPSRFFILIRNIKEKEDDIYYILAHEMVHIKQFVMREYYSISDENETLTHYWQGRKYVFEDYEDPYYDAPWEIEAMGRTDRLYDLWLEYKKENKL